MVSGDSDSDADILESPETRRVLQTLHEGGISIFEKWTGLENIEISVVFRLFFIELMPCRLLKLKNRPFKKIKKSFLKIVFEFLSPLFINLSASKSDLAVHIYKYPRKNRFEISLFTPANIM